MYRPYSPYPPAPPVCQQLPRSGAPKGHAPCTTCLSNYLSYLRGYGGYGQKRQALQAIVCTPSGYGEGVHHEAGACLLWAKTLAPRCVRAPMPRPCRATHCTPLRCRLVAQRRFQHRAPPAPLEISDRRSALFCRAVTRSIPVAPRQKLSPLRATHICPPPQPLAGRAANTAAACAATANAARKRSNNAYTD